MRTSTLISSAAVLSVAFWGAAAAATSSGNPAGVSAAAARSTEISCRTLGSEVNAQIDAEISSPNISAARAAFELGVADCMWGRDEHANKHYQEAQNLLSHNRPKAAISSPLGPLPGQQAASAKTNTSPASLGMTLKPLSDSQRQFAAGVLVSQVDPDSWAWQSGVRSGDVIVRVGIDQVTTPLQLAEAVRLARQEDKEQIPVMVMRKGTTHYLGLTTD